MLQNRIRHRSERPDTVKHAYTIDLERHQFAFIVVYALSSRTGVDLPNPTAKEETCDLHELAGEVQTKRRSETERNSGPQRSKKTEADSNGIYKDLISTVPNLTERCFVV